MKLFRIAVSVLVLVLAACGGGVQNPTIFSPENAWTEDTTGAKIVTKEEFEQQVRSGEIVLDTPALRDQRFRAAQEKIKKDQAFLRGIPAAELSPDVQDLLQTKVDLPTMPDGNYVTEVEQNDGSSTKVVTLGTASMSAIISDGYERSSRLENQLDAYRLGYEVAPEAVRSGLPSPDSLKGKNLAELLAARDALDSALESHGGLDGLRIETQPYFSPQVGAQATIELGDEATDCARREAGIFRNFWWPLKNFQTNIKQQGMRGTCWGFAAVAALESREMVVNDRTLNLSEQFLVNKVKREWGASDYVDGGGSEFTLWKAVENNFNIPLEQYWPYNPAYGRPANAFQNDDPATPQNEQIAGTAASYRGACAPATRGADTIVYNWSCSETAHQSPWICAPAGQRNFCGYYRVVAPAGAIGVPADRTTSLWQNLWSNSAAHRRIKNFPLAEIRNQLAAGRVLIASFGVFDGFSRPDANGFVTNFAATGGRGGHVTVIVGYIDNATLRQRLPNAPQSSRGYFILKNSWGCVADGGYYYIPVDYVTRFFGELSVLNMTASRGSNWQREQANPAAQDRPSIQILTNPARADLRTETNLAAFFRVAQPAARSVNLQVSSDRDGVLFDGAWNTDPQSFGSDLRRTFTSLGSRTISLVARVGSTEARASFTLNVVNTPPTLELQYTGLPSQGEDFLITAVVRDINETNATLLCNNTTWAVDGTDTLSSPTGCTQRIKFNTQGSRQVRVATRDSEGATTNQTLNLTVGPPPVNPYPRITSAGVYSREFVGSPFRFCGSALVPSGNTIDLRQEGCTFLINQPRPQRYFGGVEVENPSGETLTYTWRLYVTNIAGTSLLYSGSEAVFNLTNAGNATTVTDSCYVTLTVGAPEASRNKSLTVWAGRCTLIVGRLN